MEKKPKKKRVGRIILLVFLALLLLPPAALYAYLSIDHFHIDALREGYDRAAPYAGTPAYRDDGYVELALRAEDVYWLIDEYDALAELDIPLIELRGYAIELGAAELTLYAHMRALRFVSLPIKVTATVKSGEEIELAVERIQIGSWIEVPPEKLEKYGLESSYTIGYNDLFEGADIQAVRFEDGQIRITVPFLSDFCKNITPNATADTLLLYGVEADEAIAAASACYHTADSKARNDLLCTAEAGSAQHTEALTRLLALCDAESAEAALHTLTSFEAHFILPVSEAKVAQVRAAYTKPIADYNAKLETLLNGLREKYKALEIELRRDAYIDTKTGEPLSLGALCPALNLDDALCRVMLLTATETRKAASAAGMPLFSDIPKSRGLKLDMALDYMSYDIGAMLPMPDGSTAMLYYASTGELIVQCLPAETAESVLARYRTPRVLNLDGAVFSTRRTVREAPAPGLKPYIVFLPLDVEAVYRAENK